MITQAELERLIKEPENERVEKTIALNKFDKLGEVICAFGNDIQNHQVPGYFLIGVKNDGRLSGYKASEKDVQTILDFRSDGRVLPPPTISVKVFELETGDVLVVEVMPSMTPPMRYNQVVHVRVGPRRSKATMEEERRLIEKRSIHSPYFDVMPCLESTLDDLNLDLFRSNYLPQAIDHETLAANHRPVEHQLASLKFFDSRREVPTYAGILLFASNPLFFLPGAYVQYVKFVGENVTSDFVFEKRFDGDLQTVFRLIKEFISIQIVREVQHRLGDPYERNYPAFAIQELVYNAIIHRDYQSSAPIKFYEFSDRIEISNPGSLFGLAKIDNIRNVSDYRNPTVAEASKILGYVNKFTIGIQRVFELLRNNGNPDPEFMTDYPGQFVAKIFAKR